jgi:membrane protease YdiL (CAAX protease family)
VEIEEQLNDERFIHPDKPTQTLDVITPTPNDPPWSVAAAFGVWISSVLFILIIPAAFLLPYLFSQSITDPAEIAAFAVNDVTAVVLQVIAIIPAHIFTLLLAWWVVTRGRKYKARDTLGFDKGGFVWWHYCAILAGFFAIAAIVGHYVPEQENDLIRILRSSRTAVYLVAFMATFTAPVVEELVYRGVLYSAFQRTFGVPAAFLFVTLLFAVVHVPQYYPSYATIFLLTLLSVILTLIRVRSGNLLPCIILHTLFNGFQSVLLILEPFLKEVQENEQLSVVLRIIN